MCLSPSAGQCSSASAQAGGVPGASVPPAEVFCQDSFQIGCRIESETFWLFRIFEVNGTSQVRNLTDKPRAGPQTKGKAIHRSPPWQLRIGKERDAKLFEASLQLL